MEDKGHLFKKGNKIGEETRFQPNNNISSKYKESYCEDIINYFSNCLSQDNIIYEESYYKDGSIKSRKPIILPIKYPTFELYANSIGVVTNTLLNWCKEYPRFADAYARAKEIQKGILTQNAVAGKYNPLYAKFEAVNNHEQKDKSEVNTTVTELSDDDRKLLNNCIARMGDEDIE